MRLPVSTNKAFANAGANGGRVRIHAATTGDKRVRLSVRTPGRRGCADAAPALSVLVASRRLHHAALRRHRPGPVELAHLMAGDVGRADAKHSDHEAARELRKRFDGMQLPIIALTAAALVSERDQAIACGMNEFLTKPIDAKRLKATLARCIARQFVL